MARTKIRKKKFQIRQQQHHSDTEEPLVQQQAEGESTPAEDATQPPEGEQQPVAGELAKSKQETTSPQPPTADLGAFNFVPPDVGRHIVKFLPFASVMNLLVINKRMREWMSHVVQAPAGGRLSDVATDFWLRHCAKPQPGDSPVAVLEAVRQIDREPYNESVWALVGKLVDSDFKHWSEILGELAIRRGEFGKGEVLLALEQLLPTQKEKLALRQGYIGVAAKVDPLRLVSITTPPTQVADTVPQVTGKEEGTIRKLVHDRLRTRFNKIKSVVSGKQSTAYRAKQTQATSPDQRALDRLSWVLTHLEDARQCVSVALSKNNMRIWANMPDAEMQADLTRLFTAATAGAQEAEAQLATIWTDLHKSNLGVRPGKPTPQAWHDAERRLLKTLRFLADLLTKFDKIRLSAHSAAYERTSGELVHTETQASDDIKHSRDLLKADLRKLEELTGIKVMLQEVAMAIGISKLSCFKCWITLLAARTEGIDLKGSGTHGKSFGKWTMPAAVGSSPQVLKAILGVTGANKGDADLAGYIDDPTTVSAVLKAINTFPEESAAKKTIYYSSEEEDGLDFKQHPTVKKRQLPVSRKGAAKKPKVQDEKPEEISEEEDVPNDGDGSSDEDFLLEDAENQGSSHSGDG
ncbi:nucleic acid/nucleotide deaminase domain-containing protein [Nonomuraea gerenzanensis]|uniref:Uncharacterized protein n=1 Tax=Nonomuraea gerenzanensis TaxID=93944 RepID=A0A1M4EDU8_9ACTN|nr:nucleic acid/nucleotide deaminase domain-containing protein [Nonomuraea gerenzanensis]UBU08503.1 nucleic acid/nucleotide deaminase domain-containing protein [Nonomuraea gerenzanensis]SBO96848.1 hypothetical protein BN4615_P6364 [Nonomuraea gerenzanensis]